MTFANKTQAAIILEKEFREMHRKSLINIHSDESTEEYYHGIIKDDIHKQVIHYFDTHFYVCNQPLMMKAVLKNLHELGADENAVTVEM